MPELTPEELDEIEKELAIEERYLTDIGPRKGADWWAGKFRLLLAAARKVGELEEENRRLKKALQAYHDEWISQKDIEPTLVCIHSCHAEELATTALKEERT